MQDVHISTKPAVMEGLKGVVFTESKLSFIDGEKGILKYVGIPIQELAENSTYEETAFLLLNARLPTGPELAALDQELKGRRAIPAGLLEVMKLFPKGLHPMHGLRTAVSSLAMFDPRADDISEAGKLLKAYNLIAQLPTLIAAMYRTQNDLPVIAPRSDYCANIAHPAAEARFAFQKKTLETLQGEIDQTLIVLEEKRQFILNFEEKQRKQEIIAQKMVVDIFAKMKPDIAARQLEKVDFQTSVSILSQLNVRVASTILNEMQTDTAAAIASAMAEVNVPTVNN